MLDILKEYFIIVPGALLIITCVLIMILKIKYSKYNKATEGEILDFYVSGKKMSSRISYDVDGKKFDFISGYYRKKLKKHDKVSVYYCENDPSDVIVDSKFRITALLGGITTVLFIINFVIIKIL